MSNNDFDKEVRLAHYRSGIEATREVGVLALRTIITLNSGAFVVLLTFIGNTSANSQFAVPLSALKTSMYLFLSGIALSFAAIAHTYVVSQGATPYQKKRTWMTGLFVPVVTIVTGLAVLAFLAGVVIVVKSVELAQ